MNLVYVVNLLLCIIIVILGYWGYKKGRDFVPLYIGIAFGLFGLSHLAVLLGVNAETLLIAIRLLAYLIVVYTLYKIAFKK